LVINGFKGNLLGVEGNGISLLGNSPNTVIEGTYIGTNADGNAEVPNEGSGVRTAGPSTGTRIGGTTADARNLISGNDRNGVILLSNSNTVQINLIGTFNTGVPGGGAAACALGNGSPGPGITIFSASHVVTHNVVACSGEAGVIVSDETISNPTGNRILSNSSLSNGDLGIDLVGGTEHADGVTADDSEDPDPGSNRLQNFPRLISATTASSGTTTISGSLNSRPDKSFTVQFFSNSVEDPSAKGEGESFLGQKRVRINQRGKASFTFSKVLPPGENVVSATATNGATGDASEFSNAVTAS
jgi:hypothetical protein